MSTVSSWRAGRYVDGARQATAAGLPVLVEKPPTRSAARAAVLERLDPPPWVGFNRRFDPGVVAVRTQVPTEGPARPAPPAALPAQSWHAHAARDDVLLDLDPHLVDLKRAG